MKKEMTISVDVNTVKILNDMKGNKQTIEEYISKMLDMHSTNIVVLAKGYYYDKYLRKMFNKNHVECNTTKIQKEIIELLIKNNGNLVYAETILKDVWGSKKHSIYTLRNMVKQIRDNSCYEIIKSISSKGYRIQLKG